MSLEFDILSCSRYHIGKGGYGQVFKGVIKDKTRKTYVKVAIKKVEILSNEAEANKQMVSEEAVLKEIGILSDCRDNSFIVLYLGHRKIQNTYLIITEFCRKLYFVDLFKSVPERRRAEVALLCLCALSHALTFLHKQDIVHRDVKPGNILFDNFGVLKLIDFGMACSMTQKKIATKSGTEFFIAPEAYCKGHLLSSYDTWGAFVAVLSGCMVKQYEDLFDLTWDYMIHGFAGDKEFKKVSVGQLTGTPTFHHLHLNKHEQLFEELRKEALVLDPEVRLNADQLLIRLDIYLKRWNLEDITMSEAARTILSHIRRHQVKASPTIV